MGCIGFLVTILIILAQVAGPHIAIGDDGLHFCNVVESGNWDNFDDKGNWTEGGFFISCDDVIVSQTRSASEAEDLGLPPGSPLPWEAPP